VSLGEGEGPDEEVDRAVIVSVRRKAGGTGVAEHLPVVLIDGGGGTPERSASSLRDPEGLEGML